MVGLETLSIPRLQRAERVDVGAPQWAWTITG
jgi:hypothetical protein